MARERRESTQKESPKAPVRTQPGTEAESETRLLQSRFTPPRTPLSQKKRMRTEKEKCMQTVLCCAFYKACSLQTAPRPRRREGLAPRRGEGRPTWVKIGLQCWSAAGRQAVSFSLRVCASRLRPPRGVIPPAGKVSARPSDPPGMCVLLAACPTQLLQAYEILSKRLKPVLDLAICS